MKITHIGAENCVTGSCHLIQTDPAAGDVNILVDCGIAQGHDPVLPFDQWPVAPSAIDYLFLTHADQQTLCDCVAAMPKPPGEIRLVHGEPRTQTTLARKLNIT